MPILVILNTNQSKSFALVLPRNSAAEEQKETILREARNKFRIKGLSTVFIQGGGPWPTEDPDTSSIVKVWISKDEPYAGPPNPVVVADPNSVRVIAERSYIDEQAVKQLRACAALPGVYIAVGMPDLHPGNRWPIGCAVAAEGVYPALLGSDVGCGIALYDLGRAKADPHKLSALLRGLDASWDGSTKEWLAKYGIERETLFDEKSLGTVGLGNHFAEICVVEKVVDEEVAKRIGVSGEEGGLYLLVHTGSRGLGASLLAGNTKNQSNPYFAPNSAELSEYLVGHDHAVQWAIANRDLVAHRVKECLFPGDSSRDIRKLIDVTHNSATKHAVTVQDGTSLELWVHRKGAAPTEKGVIPCPGSRGHLSWLLEPTGDGQQNLFSLAHGAGRRHPRSALHEYKLNKSTLQETSLGSVVVCTDPTLLLEERPEAYKDIQWIVKDMEDKGVAKGVVVLRPVVTYKTREGGERRD